MAFVSGFAVGKGSSFLASRRCDPSGAQASRKCSPRKRVTMRVYDVDIELYGKQYTVPVDENLTLLEGIEEYGLEVPYSCRAGVCITCAAKVLAGKVDPGEAAITDDLKEQGYVLTCSAFPMSDGIKLELNHFEDAYDQQYGRFEAK